MKKKTDEKLTYSKIFAKRVATAKWIKCLITFDCSGLVTAKLLTFSSSDSIHARQSFQNTCLDAIVDVSIRPFRIDQASHMFRLTRTCELNSHIWSSRKKKRDREFAEKRCRTQIDWIAVDVVDSENNWNHNSSFGKCIRKKNALKTWNKKCLICSLCMRNQFNGILSIDDCFGWAFS